MGTNVRDRSDLKKNVRLIGEIRPLIRDEIDIYVERWR